MDGKSDEAKSSGSWWTTLPGLITAIAGLATAIGGVILVLHQVGYLGATGSPAQASTGSPQVQEAQTAATPAVEGAATPVAAPSPQVAKDAGITRKNGESIDVRADTLRDIDEKDRVTFENGQSIALDRIVRLEVIEANNGSDKPTVALRLVSGKTVSGLLPYGASSYGFKGVNDLGDVEVRLNDIKSVDFGR
jgi:hypothetical protein